MQVAELGGMSKCICSVKDDGRNRSDRPLTLKPILKESSVVMADRKPSVSGRKDARLMELQAAFFYVQNTQFR